MDEDIIITNHSSLQYYMYTNGSIFDREVINKNILKDYNISSLFLDIGEFNINRSNRYTYYLKQQQDKVYLLSIQPKVLPVLIDDNMIIKSDTLEDEDREIVNLLFKIQQFVILKHTYNRYIGLADKYIIFYNVQYGENELITYNIESVMDVTTITIEDMGKLIKIKEKFFGKYEHEWDQFLELVQVCNKIFSKDKVNITGSNKTLMIKDKETKPVISIESIKAVTENKKEAINRVPKTVKDINQSHELDIELVDEVYKNISNKKYTNIEKEYIAKYINMIKGIEKEREFNKYWSKKNPDKIKKIIARPILQFIFEDVLNWNENDIYNQFSSSLLISYKLDKMWVHVFNNIAVDAVLLIYPEMKVFLFKSLSIFTWYYVRSHNGVEHAKETLKWIVKTENIDISSRKNIITTDWHEILAKYELQNIITGSLYKKNISLFLEEIFDI